MQLTTEYWDVASISERTAIDHLKKKFQALVDGLIHTELGEEWKLKCIGVPSAGVRAKGGWLYQQAYCHKDFGYDWCQVCSPSGHFRA